MYVENIDSDKLLMQPDWIYRHAIYQGSLVSQYGLINLNKKVKPQIKDYIPQHQRPYLRVKKSVAFKILQTWKFYSVREVKCPFEKKFFVPH